MSSHKRRGRLGRRLQHGQRDALVLYPRHRKPFRVHHLASLLVALAVVLGCIFELGFVAGREGAAPEPRPVAAGAAAGSVAPEQTQVRSGYGFSFSAPAGIFNVSGTMPDASGQPAVVTGARLKAGLPLISTVVKARPGALDGRLAAAELTVTMNTATPAMASGGELSTRKLSEGPDRLGGVVVQKSVYEFTAAHGGKSYAVVWTGTLKGRAFTVELNGLAGSPAVPGEFAAVLASLRLADGQAVLGAQTVFAAPAAAKGALDARYLSDALSPAVVQIFHTVCGVLTVDGRALGGSDCVSFSGSGFLATSSGYIATNGHVVVYSAKDALAALITSNDNVLQAYLRGIGLTQAQADSVESDPAALAATIAKIYDLPDSRLHFANQSELTLVALGSDLPDLKKLAAIHSGAQLAHFKADTESIKQAAVVAYDYNSKDSLTAVADPRAGFSSSDVALLKVDTSRAPAIPIETGRVFQNEKIVIMGFPGDANNVLTDNQRADVTVTDGVVSAIRQAAGGRGLLYQSDADASHGSSGGPAIDEQGRVIGLMTYRYADAQTGDAPKSYVRDIADFTRLAADNGVRIDSRSFTQAAWMEGLQLYSQNHFSAALKDFQKVAAAYPAQRLVGSYIVAARQAIVAGKDVPDVPVRLLVLVLAAGLAGAAAAIIVIIRHNALHKVYRTSVPGASGAQPVYLAKKPPATM